MPLPEEFNLTPRESYYRVQSDQFAALSIIGATFWPKYNDVYKYSFDRQHLDDRLYYYSSAAADPALDYTVWSNLKMAPHIRLSYDLSSLGAHKELALVFQFEAVSNARLLIFTNNGLLGDETLVQGDDQFLMEVETLDRLDLYFIHTRMAGSAYGSNWFFKGIKGYVV